MCWITNADVEAVRALGPEYAHIRRPAWWRQIVRNLRDVLLGD